MSFLGGPLEWPLILAAGVGCTVVRVGAGWREAEAPWQRWLGRLLAIGLVGLHLLWVYLGLSFGWMLYWTAAPWVPPLLLALLLLSVATHFTHRWPQIPLALPLGLWIAILLSGWLREEHLVRCDDYLSIRAPVSIEVRSHPALAECRPGVVRASGRFPRTIWQDPEGQRVRFTTQGRPTPGGIDGGICEATLGDPDRIVCIGPPAGKSQAFLEWPEQNRQFVFQWGITTPKGTPGAVIHEMPLRDPLRVVRSHWFDEFLGEGFLDPVSATIYAFSDRYNGVYPLQLPDLTQRPTIPFLGFEPGESYFDPERNEGVLCGPQFGVAVRGHPVELRRFVNDESPWIDRLSASWGCAWDPAAQQVYATVPNFWMLVRLDARTGKVNRRWIVGPGMRSTTYDARRRRVYFTDFLRGYILGFDEDSGRIVNRWFVGRFPRWVRPTPDGGSLLVTSNLGIVRISLEDAAPPVSAGGTEG